MNFGAKRQSLMIFLMLVILICSSLVGNCHADRNPISLEGPSICKDWIDADDVRQLKQDLKRNEKRWSELKSFAVEQATVAKQKLASLNFNDWLQMSSRGESPAANNSESTGVSPTAMAVNLVANMTAVQYWQASDLAAGLFDSGQRRLVETTTALTDQIQNNLGQLIETTSDSVVQLATGPGFDKVVQAITFTNSANSSSDDLSSIESQAISFDGDPAADPYWVYYSDCDFWGAQFQVVVE